MIKAYNGTIHIVDVLGIDIVPLLTYREIIVVEGDPTTFTPRLTVCLPDELLEVEQWQKISRTITNYTDEQAIAVARITLTTELSPNVVMDGYGTFKDHRLRVVYGGDRLTIRFQFSALTNLEGLKGTGTPEPIPAPIPERSEEPKPFTFIRGRHKRQI
jgi:hypothetical protein